MWRFAMPNKKERIKVIDYLYAEMTSKEKEAYHAELNNFPELKENINNFKSLRNSIRKWKGTGVRKNIVDSFEIYSSVFVGGVFIILLAVLNLNVSFNSGRFSISFGLLSRQADTVITEKFSGEIDKNNEQLLQVVRDYILERDQKQIDEIVKLIKASETRYNEKRKFELKAIYTEIANLKLNTNRYLVNANQAIQGLFQYMSRINSNNTNSSGNSI
jgi:hypothetical protein